MYQIFNFTLKGPKEQKDTGFIEMCDWIKNNLPEESVFGSVDIPHWIYLYSGYKSGPRIPMTKDDNKIIDFIKRNNYDYLVVSPNFGRSYQYLKPAIEKNIHMFSVVYSKNGNIIYKVLQ